MKFLQNTLQYKKNTYPDGVKQGGGSGEGASRASSPGGSIPRYLSFSLSFLFLFFTAVATAFFFTPSVLDKVTGWPVSPALQDSGGRLFHVRLSADGEYCLPVPLEEMGRWLPLLAVEVEDRRFYGHCGVDFLALGRALGQNVLGWRRVSGASTITSQLVRIAVPRGRNFWTKFVEFTQAIKLERELSKREILELYLNRAPLGGPFRGVEAAAMGYFGKRARELTLAESAALVAMFKGPTYYRPNVNAKGLLERRNFILDSLAERGGVGAEELRLAKLEKIPAVQAALPAEFRHFSDQAFKSKPAEYWLNGGAPLETSLDRQAQRLLEQALEEGLAAFPSGVTGAGIIVDNKSRDVPAYVGNARFNSAGGKRWVDCGDSPRSPGSALKPFVYLEAMEQGLIVPGSLLADTPLSFGGSAPRNFDRMYRGPVTASTALADSLNAPAVRVLRLAGGESALHRLRRLGFGHLTRSAEYYGDSLVLGGCEVTLIELARAYAALANLGEIGPLIYVNTNGDPFAPGRPISPSGGVPRPDGSAPKRRFSKAAAYLMAEMLSDTSRLPFAQRESLAQRGRRAAVKTGTSYGFRDAWACAYTPEHTVIIWYGCEDGAPDDGLVGISGPAPAAVRVLRDIPMQNSKGWFEKPEDVEDFIACPLSGMPVSPFCPKAVPAVRVRGVSRTMPCMLHRESREGPLTVLPPELEEYARLRTLAVTPKAAVDITSPKPRARFFLNPAAPEQKINLACEGAVGQVYWFVNKVFYAAQEAGKPLLWPMRAGKFTVSLIDGEGRTASSVFEVVDVAEKEVVPLRFGD